MSLVINVPRGMDRIQVENQRRQSVVFFGTPIFAVPALRALYREGWPITLVVTAPDKPVGRKAIVRPSPVNATAHDLGLEVATPESLKDPDFQRRFSELKPDVAVVVAYGKLIPESVLSIPRLGFLNIHPSLLPAYRGPSPIKTAILDGCASTGISIMQLDEEMDHGPIVAQRSWPIPSGFDAAASESELASLGAQLLIETLPGYLDGSCMPVPQRHEDATFTKKFSRQDGRLDWSQSVVRIYDRIRALADEPGTWCAWRDTTIGILRASVFRDSVPARSGTVVATPQGVGIACHDGVLMVEQLRPEGGKVMSIAAFINGHPDFIGSEVT